MPPAASERKNRPKHMGPYQKVTERTAAAATARANATREHKNRAYQMLGVHVSCREAGCEGRGCSGRGVSVSDSTSTGNESAPLGYGLSNAIVQ